MRVGINPRDALDRVCVLVGLPEPVKDSLARAAEWRIFAAGQMVYEQGEPSGGVFGLISGSAKVTLTAADGSEAILGFLRVGELFGELECMDGGGPAAAVVALEPCTALFVPCQRFVAIVGESPELQRRILGHWARIIRLLLRRTKEQAQLAIPARLARRLLDIHELNGSVRTRDGLQLRYLLSQQDLGGLIEATRESVNKCLREWDRAGIVTHNRGVLTIRDEAQLRRAAERVVTKTPP